MATGTIIMIVCAVLYGLIVILFKEDNIVIEDDESSMWGDPFTCVDGTPGADGLFADDFDIVPPK